MKKLRKDHKDHKLYGKYKGYKGLHVDPKTNNDWLLVYRIFKNELELHILELNSKVCQINCTLPLCLP